MSTIGQRIRDQRLQLGLTQTQLAEGIVTPSMISQIEAGKTPPSRNLLKKLAERLQAPIEDLYIPPSRKETLTTITQTVRACIAMEAYDAAEELLAIAMESTDAEGEALDLHGLLHLAGNRLPNAGEAFYNALSVAQEREQWEETPELYMWLGDTYAKAGDHSLALHMYELAEQALQHFPHASSQFEADLALRLSAVLHELEEFERAADYTSRTRERLTIGEAARERARQDAVQAARMAQSGDEDEARRLVREVNSTHQLLQWHSTLIRASLLRVDQLLILGDTAEAENILSETLVQQAYMRRDEQAACHLAQAHVRLLQQRLPDALQETRTALALDPPSSEQLLSRLLTITSAALAAGEKKYARTWLTRIQKDGEQLGLTALALEAKRLALGDAKNYESDEKGVQ